MRYWEDFDVGVFGLFGPLRVNREDIVSFASEFDPQPMHLDDTAGQASMLGGLAASGWHSCALMTRLMVDGYLLDSTSMGAPGVEEVKWVTPLRPGDEVSMHAMITGKRASKSRPEMGLVFFTLELRNQRDECIMLLKNTQMFARRNPDGSGA